MSVITKDIDHAFNEVLNNLNFTDWTQNSDNNLSEEKRRKWKEYRKNLRLTLELIIRAINNKQPYVTYKSPTPPGYINYQDKYQDIINKILNNNNTN